MLIEGDPDVRAILVRLLQSTNLQVFEATGGVVGLALFDDCRPDLVITEIVMRPMDGIKVISAIRAKAPQLPIIALSSEEHPDYLQTFERAEAFGGVETLQIPFPNEQFLAAVSRSLAIAGSLASQSVAERV